ncbi:MAG: peroxiredoxin [Dehalococcoidia bacterium]|nr:peroxiredoxin [Dehalococcoidia bacterium]
MLHEGARLPEFELRSPGRDAVTLADFLGAPVVVAFFPQAFTAGCRAELRAFQLALPDFDSLGARVVGVSADTWFEHRRFAQAEGLEFPLLSDWPDGRLLSAVGVRDEDGRARRVTVVADRDQAIRGVIEGVAPADHCARALTLLRGLVHEAPGHSRGGGPQSSG